MSNRRAVCKNTEHHDEPIRGSTRERCSKCGDEFPCKRSCGHLDCMQARGEPPPEWADYDLPDREEPDAKCAPDADVFPIGKIRPVKVLADHAAVMEYTREVGYFVDEDKVHAAEASIVKLEADHPQIAQYREWQQQGTIVNFGCVDETGHVAVSHVTIDGETSLHMIPPGEHKAQLVSIDVVDGKLVQTIRVVEPKEEP